MSYVSKTSSKVISASAESASDRTPDSFVTSENYVQSGTFEDDEVQGHSIISKSNDIDEKENTKHELNINGTTTVFPDSPSTDGYHPVNPQAAITADPILKYKQSVNDGNPITDIITGLRDGNRELLETGWDRLLFRPTDPFKMKWDIIIMGFSLFNCFSVPIQVCFEPEGLNNIGFNILNYMIDCFFFMDMIISFRSVVFNDKGEEDTRGYSMAMSYLQTTFVIDFLATVPFELILPSSANISYDLFGILKLGRILRLSKIIRYLRTTNDVKATLRIFKMVLFLSVYLHCYTCLWWQIASKTKTWIPPMDQSIGIDYSIY